LNFWFKYNNKISLSSCYSKFPRWSDNFEMNFNAEKARSTLTSKLRKYSDFEILLNVDKR
jgi:hypothetical protein